jgi:hypothetical protein
MSRKVLPILIGAFVLALVLAAFFLARTWSGWTTKGKLAPSGGRYFFRKVELAVPQFFQADEKWRDDQLGYSSGTLGAEGCAIASVAMIFKFYGIDTDPQRLNWFLDAADGYTPQGWVYWEKAAELAPDRTRHVYEDLPSYFLIDSNLARGNPVIVRLRLKNGVTHFVVIAGKQGWDYLIRDPSPAGARGIYPLRDFGSDIEALRFYEKI